MRTRALAGLVMSFSLLLSACGGGGGGSDTTPPAAPTVTIALTPTKVSLGQSAAVTWSSTDATTCTASSGWSGAKPTTGTDSVTPTAGGRINYALACTGPGGTASQSATLVVPMPVFPSSYENAKKIVLDDPNMPTPYALNLPNASSLSGSTAFADFFQEGAYSAVVTMQDFGVPLTAPLTIFFLRKNASGNWIDATSLLLTDRTSCFNRKTLIADFNGDGKPDVFFVCTGYDFLPFPGDKQRILLSQPDGTYSNVELPFARTYSFGGSAGDLNGDGKPDVVLTAEGTGSITGPTNPFVLLNNGDGTFTQVFDRLPDVLPAFTLELIDTAGNGYYDLFVGDGPADGSTTLPNGVLLNDGAGYFRGTPIIKFPNPPGPNGCVTSIAQDFAYVDGWLYMAQTDNHDQCFAVRKLRLSDFAISTPYQHYGFYNDNRTGPSWIYPRASDRKIIPQGDNSIYPIDPNSAVGWSIDY